jgi:outer membrane protein TolC
MSNLEVNNAQLTLTQTEVNYYQALFDYRVATINLLRAIEE